MNTQLSIFHVFTEHTLHDKWCVVPNHSVGHEVKRGSTVKFSSFLTTAVHAI
jgi:hypothetical protein